MSLGEDLKKIFLVGVGAMAITGEKAQEITNTLIAKGDLTMEQGKVLNQELRRTINKTLQCSADTCIAGKNNETQEGEMQEKEIGLSQIIDKVDSLTTEELIILEEKLAARKCEQ